MVEVDAPRTPRPAAAARTAAATNGLQDALDEKEHRTPGALPAQQPHRPRGGQDLDMGREKCFRPSKLTVPLPTGP